MAGNLELTRASIRYLTHRIVGWRLAKMLVAIGIMLLVGWLTNRPAILLGNLVDSVIAKSASSFKDILPTLVLISVILVGKEVLTWLRKYLVESVSTRIERDEFVSIVEKLLTIDLSHMIGERVGSLNVRVHRSIEGVVRLLKLVFLDFMPTLSVAVAGFMMALIREWRIAAIMAAVAAVGGFVTLLQIQSQKGIRLSLFRAKEDIGGKVIELLNGIEYVRAVGAWPREVNDCARLAETLREKEFRHHRWMMSFDFAKQGVESFGYVAVISLGCWLAAKGAISPGDVLVFAMLFGSVATPLRDLHRIIDDGFEAMLRIGDLLGLHELPRDRGLDGAVNPIAHDASVPVVECSDLSMVFGGDGARQPVLRGVNFTAFAGETIGIAGASGSGKSTFVKILLGLIEGYSGSARVFGVEVREAKKEKLAKMLSYVSQNAFVVRGSLYENLLYGNDRKEFDDKLLWEVLEKAQLSTLARSLPAGLESEIAEQGRNLSGGERQRVMLARVFLKDADLLILDEATAALDNVNERLIQKAIEELTAGRTALVIAHRLSTLRSADRIVVFESGSIVENGTYDSLVDRGGVFRRLVDAEQRREDGGALVAGNNNDPGKVEVAGTPRPLI